MVADLTPEQTRGLAYGLRQALDTLGAFVGPLMASALMMATGNQFRSVFWIAVVPAFIAVGACRFLRPGAEGKPAKLADGPLIPPNGPSTA